MLACLILDTRNPIPREVSSIKHRNCAAEQNAELMQPRILTGNSNNSSEALSFSGVLCPSFWKDKYECCIALPTAPALAVLDCICLRSCDSRWGGRTREKQIRENYHTRFQT